MGVRNQLNVDFFLMKCLLMYSGAEPFVALKTIMQV